MIVEGSAMTATASKKEKTNPDWYHHLDGAKLARLGVKILNRFDLALECNTCGERWSPSHRTDGRLVEGYWRCPNRCNW